MTHTVQPLPTQFPLRPSPELDSPPSIDALSDLGDNDSHEYDVYPLDEDMPAEYSSEIDDDDGSQSVWVDSPDEAESSILESSVNVEEISSQVELESNNNDSDNDSADDTCIPLVQPQAKMSSGDLEPLNLAFASWSWTHGISFDAFYNLQQLLHSEMIHQQLPLLHTFKGVREQVSKFLRLCPLHTIRIHLKTSKLPTRTRNSARVHRVSAALIAKNTLSTLFYHQIHDLLYRVLSNPKLKSQMYNEQYTTIHSPSSAPWHRYAWRSSYTLSKGPDPPQINGNTVYPGRFVLFSQKALQQDKNLERVKSFDLHCLLKNSTTLRIGHVCSVVRRANVEYHLALACEVDPIVTYDELPSHLQTESRSALTPNGATQCFMADFEWNKPLINFEELESTFDGTSDLILSL
jgi:hypothetical protein